VAFVLYKNSTDNSRLRASSAKKTDFLKFCLLIDTLQVWTALRVVASRACWRRCCLRSGSLTVSYA